MSENERLVLLLLHGDDFWQQEVGKFNQILGRERGQLAANGRPTGRYEDWLTEIREREEEKESLAGG